MAEAIVGPLLSKLQEVAVKEGKALAGVGDEIDRLRERLMWLHALVYETDLRSRSEGNQLIRVLARQMREIAFEAEDAVDHFVLKVDLSRFGRHWRRAARLFFANFVTQIYVRYILSQKIKSMNARLEDIHDNSTKYGSNNESTSAITWRASRYIPPVRHNWDDMGSDESKEPNKTKKTELTKLLLDMEKPAGQVIYVVGESGIGKRHLVVVDCPVSSTVLGNTIVGKFTKGGKGSKIVLATTSSPPGFSPGQSLRRAPDRKPSTKHTLHLSLTLDKSLPVAHNKHRKSGSAHQQLLSTGCFVEVRSDGSRAGGRIRDQSSKEARRDLDSHVLNADLQNDSNSIKTLLKDTI